ncbi:MAG: hypothetical protein KDD39_16175 [Bdellovibrionales bacterium]|nr:hypothetical protein [Bdellovibrionales bacterium]
MPRFSLFVLAFVLPVLGLSAILPIPREVHHNYVDEGIFEGGSLTAANLVNIRLGQHNAEGFERWVVDFEDPKTHVLGQSAPRFSLRYAREQVGMAPTGEENLLLPARLLLSLRRIESTSVTQERLDKLVERSKLVKAVILHPSIESGDRVVEFVLRRPARFEAHQPKSREGRLVLDLKPSTGE